MMPCWCSALPGGVRLAVQVQPNAKKTEVMGVFDDALKIRLQAQPIDGKANDALIAFLAKRLSVPRKALTITHGLASRRKVIALMGQGLSPEALLACLAP